MAVPNEVPYLRRYSLKFRPRNFNLYIFFGHLVNLGSLSTMAMGDPENL